ncbi:AAA family ATPase [Candidatus Poribacteria bacterium]|nr:AAA family ATPase [Candidatus Poribacteria bacterium]
MNEQTDTKLEQITEIRLLDYFWILYRNKWSVIAIFLLCVIGAFVVTDLTQPVYQSETTLRILDGQGPSSILSGLPIPGILRGPSSGTYATLIQSRDLVIAPAVRELRSQGLLEPLPIYRGKLVRWFANLFNVDLDPTLTEQGDLTITEWEDAYIKTLIDEKIKVEENQDADVLTLSVKQRKPEHAQLLCDKIAEILIRTIDAETDEKARWWEKPSPIAILGDVTEKRKEAENALFEFQEKNPELTLNTEGGTQVQLILALRLSENELVSQLIGAELRLAAFEDELEKVDEEIISETISRNPSYVKLQDELNKYEIERKALIGKYGNVKHPEISSLDEKIIETKKLLEGEDKEIKSTTSSYNPLHQIIAQNINETQATIKGLKEQKQIVSSQIDEHINELSGWSDNQLELYRLKRDAEIYNTQVGALEARIRESEILDEARTDNLKVLDQARLSQEPIKPRMKINLVLGAMLGGLLGFTFAVVKNYFKDTYLRLEDSVRQLDSLPEPPSFIGVIPSIKRRSTYRIPLVVHDSPNSKFAESFRAIGAKLPFLNPGGKMETVLVTSSTRGEGKSCISSNLSATYAQAGKKVLLIDADMRRPSQHTHFPAEQLMRILYEDAVHSESEDIHETPEITHSDPRKPGLSEMLITMNNENNYEVFRSTVRETGIPNLHLIPGGTVPPNPIELLNSDMMTQLLEIAKSEYDIVIIDSPPVRAVADPVILAMAVDAVVYVFDITKTKRIDVLTGLKLLKDVLPEKGLGVVCNMINPKHARSYGYYDRHSVYYELTDQGG